MMEIEEVNRCADSLVEAFGSNNVERYFEHFDPNATFIFYTHDKILYSRQEYVELWNQWVRKSNFTVLSCTTRNRDVRFSDAETAILTHEVTTLLSFDGNPEQVNERETIVFHKKSDGWLAVHEHLSPISPVSEQV